MNFYFYVAKRYFFSRKNPKIVNWISTIAVLALSISTAALIVILSVFEGLKELNLNIYKNVTPDIKISSLKGKELRVSPIELEKISNLKEVKTLSKTLEDKVYIEYRNKSSFAYLKGVDENYANIIPLDNYVFYGESCLSRDHLYTPVIIGLGIARSISLSIEDQEKITFFSIDPTKKIIEEGSLLKKEASVSGVFHLNQETNQSYIFSSLAFAQDLFNKKNKFYSVELKLKLDANPKETKEKIKKIIGKEISVETREEQQEAFFKMVNTERLVVYLVLSLVGFITAFNLVGALIILILDKRSSIELLWAVGMRKHSIRKIFFYLGLLITLFSWLIGMCLGSSLLFAQKKYHLIKISNNASFPVEFTFSNFLLVSITIWIIGASMAYFSSKKTL